MKPIVLKAPLQAISYHTILFALAMIVTPLATFVPSLQVVRSMGMLVVVFWFASLTGGLLLYAWLGQSRKNPLRLGTAIAVSTVLAGCIHIVASYAAEISTHPLTLTWSEASRYYYASLFFSERIYGTAATPTVLHPSRYLLQAAPFLIPASPLWVHRAWQAFLWIVLPAAASLLLVRRVAVENRATRLLLGAAFFLYLFIGPVYYHLVVPVIVMLWGFEPRAETPRRRWLSLAALLFASAWSGISRVNWFPVAGLLAAALFYMEQPVPDSPKPQPSHSKHISGATFRLNREAWLYFLRPVGWTLLGTAVALLTQIGYIAWSGNAAEEFAGSFFSDLLMHRLLPNATYPPGLLPAAALVSLPPALILLARLLARSNGLMFARRIHPLRLLALAVIAGVLLAGGLLVSLKIGGGSNLHNIDAYMTLLGIITAYFAFDRVAVDVPSAQAQTGIENSARSPVSGFYTAALVSLFIIVPTFAVFPRGPSKPLPSAHATQETFDAIKEAAEHVDSQGQETLFIGERHLLAFKYLPGIPLAPDYERVYLMEAAMARNEAYLERFYTDLKQQRYGLIVSEPLSRQMKGPVDSFGAENNAWVKYVSRKVLCYYRPVKTFSATQVQLLAPRSDPDETCR